MRAREWDLAVLFRNMEDYDIPHAPVSIDDNGEEWISAENTVKVRR